MTSLPAFRSSQCPSNDKRTPEPAAVAWVQCGLRPVRGYGSSTMGSAAEWPAARRIDTRRLILDPLRVSDADEMVFVLGDATW